MCVLLYLWLVALTVPFIAAIAAWHNSRRWIRMVLCPVILAVFLGATISHPFINIALFRSAAEAHVQRKLADVEALNLIGETPETVKAHLGVPDHIVDLENRQDWHYSKGPWYTYSIDDVVVSFEHGRVASAWIDYF